MTQEEQNSVDLQRMLDKRAKALKRLEEFKEWHMPDERTDNQIVLISLTRDILRGTEDEVDRLIYHLEERNEQALMKKLEMNV